jgi:Pyruvate/2-oxoacid:ferredoxin oxidoreductase delta subunit
MRHRLFSKGSTRTSFVQLNTRKCKACWQCITKCKQQVIGKVNFPWHKHALIADHVKCVGCLKCIDECQYKAFSRVDENLDQTENHSRGYYDFIVNNLLLIFGVFMVFSGLALQLGFHIGDHNERKMDYKMEVSQSLQYVQIRQIDESKTICSFRYSDWSMIHKISIVVFSVLIIYHIYVHWKWYSGVIVKRLVGNNLQVITLSILFLLVAMTGLVPWFIDLFEKTNAFRLVFIELHDKLALILVVYLILHLAKRIKWFANTYKKFRV